MKHLLIAALAVGFVQTANAAPKAQAGQITAEQSQLASKLPSTVVVRIKKGDSKNVEVMHLNESLAPNKQALKKAAGKFEAMAMNSQMTGKAIGGADELDQSSSTSSWSFGFYGNVGNYGYYGNSYGYGYNSGYGYNNCRYSPCRNWYSPSYYYSGYRYNYYPYYGYSDNNYYYAYCNWNTRPYYGYSNNWWY